MKNIILTLILIVNISWVKVAAQDIDLGIKLGYVRSSERTNNALYGDDFKPLSNFDAGLIFGINPFNKFGIQLEPGIMRKGSNHYIPEIWESNNYQLTYFSFPILLKYRVIRNLNILVGPEFSYQLDAEMVGKENSFINSLYNKSFEFGFQSGLSYDFFDKIYIGIKYFYGITSTSEIILLNENGIITGESYKTFNKGIIFNIGFLIF